MHWLSKYAWLLIGAVCLLTYLFVVVSSIDKPFCNDEIYYAGWAHGIAKTGKPQFYQGEFGHLKSGGIVEPISHPTLHFNLLALMVLLFGLKYWSLRLLGVIFFFSFISFLRFVASKHIKLTTEKMVLVLLLLVFNPLVLQQSLVLAIESQAFWFPMLLFLYTFYRESRGGKSDGFKYYPYLLTTLTLLVLFWLKETNIPIYTLSCVLYLLLIKQYKSILSFSLTLCASAILFCLSWWVYCLVAGVDLYSWFEFTVVHKMTHQLKLIHSLVERLGIWGATSRIALGLRWTVNWVSVPFVLVLLVSLFIRGRDVFRRQHDVGFFELCALYGLTTLFFTEILRPTGSFLKYEAPAYFFFSLFIADVLLPHLASHLRTLFFISIFGLVAGVFSYFFVPDRILLHNHYFYYHALQSSVVAALIFMLLYFTRKYSTFPCLVFGLFASLISVNANLHLHQSNSYTTGISWNNYGEDRGAPIRWLRENLEDGEAFAAFKDIQFNVRFVEGKPSSKTAEVRLFTRWSGQFSEKRRILDSGFFRYLVLGRYSRPKKKFPRLYRKNYEIVWENERFAILGRKACNQCNNIEGL